jgi:hypothetical protein
VLVTIKRTFSLRTMRAEGKFVDKKRSSSTGVKISKSTDEEAPAPQSPTRPQLRGGNGSNHVTNSNPRGGAAGRPKNDVTAGGRSICRSNSAVTAVFWIMLAFGFFQITFYSPDNVVPDEHWFDKSSWKVSSSATSSRNRTKSAEAKRPSSETTKELQKQVVVEPIKKGIALSQKVQTEAKVELAKSQVEPLSPLDSANASSSVKRDSSATTNSTSHENPIMQVLIAAGLKDIDPKDLEGLPTPETLTSLYGPLKEPVVVGMDTCAEYRDKVQPSERVAAVAGMFNTGTNAMAFHLRQNINIKNTWQVPWGKHRMEYVRLNHTAEGLEHVNKENVLPIVLIRDPLYWLQRYAFLMMVAGSGSITSNAMSTWYTACANHHTPRTGRLGRDIVRIWFLTRWIERVSKST